MRFFWPKAMPDDPLSQIYSKTFYWTFLLVLLTGFLYYFVFADSLLLHRVLITFTQLVARAVGREEGDGSEYHPLLPIVLFVPIALGAAFHFYDKQDKQISNQAFKRFRHNAFLCLAFALGWAFVRLAIDLAHSKEVTAQHLVELVCLAYVFGQIGILVVRSTVVMTWAYGFSRNKQNSANSFTTVSNEEK